VLVVQRVLRAKRTNLHEKYDYPWSSAIGPTSCASPPPLLPGPSRQARFCGNSPGPGLRVGGLGFAPGRLKAW